MFLGQERGRKIPIVPPSKLPSLVQRTQARVFIINEKYWADIAKQLEEMGIRNYINLDSFLSYEYDGYLWMPVSFSKPEPYRKQNSKDFAVLYVQDKPCTRTCKIAAALKARGVNYIGDVVDSDLEYIVKSGLLSATNDFLFIEEVDFIAICVPTPLDAHQQPVLDYIKQSAENIAPHLKRGTIVVLESTTYPGTMEE